MKKKEIDPFNWDSISIQKYYDINDILNGDEDDITKNVRLVALIMDKDESEVWDMDLAEVGGYIAKLQFLNKFDLPQNTSLKINLPNYKLYVMKDLTKINIAQYVDYQNFAQMGLRDGIEKILSIFLIPEGCSYNTGYDIIDLQKEIREHMSFRVAEGLLGFFLKRYSELLIRSLVYCRRMMKKTKNLEKKEKLEKEMKELEVRVEHLIHLLGSY